ncbi:MAG: ABC transporter substrate-binding protein [Peptostreptococcaceae bacterium]|nr:ABC transporter substrate-binding protein [Peptostreptococcaceae bacterium]
MKKLNLKLLVLMLAMVLSMGMMTACGDSTESEESEAAITVTDMTGNEISLDAVPEKIVVLTPSDCEILYAIGAGDTVVGRGEYCDYPEEVLDIVTVKSGDDTNMEEVIALEPDVIVMGTMAQTEDQVAALKDAGIEVYVSDSKTIADTYENIELMGQLTGHVDEAATVVEEMKTKFADVEAKVEASDPDKTIYFEVSPLEYGLWTAGTDTFMDEISTMLGVKNVFEDISGFGEVSEEQVLERNPDLIVTTTMYFGEGPTPEEEVLARAGWTSVTAIKDGMVYNADSNMITRPGPRLADAAEALYEFIY